MIKSLKEIINERNMKYIIEGIDIDYKNRIVKFNSSHENNVNTGVDINPTFSKVTDVDVISIFKRKENKLKTDGNPLIYALKGLKGWKIDKKEIISLFRNFVTITKKIESKYDTIITMASSNPLNEKFLHRIKKVIKSKYEVTDVFRKLKVEEIYEEGIDPDISDEDFQLLDKALKKMIKDNNGVFSYKYIKPMYLRKYVLKSCDTIDIYDNEINGKDILILDDTIASGKTISDSTKSLLETYEPKSITVLTLFSSI